VRRRALALSILSSAAVLAAGWQLGTQAQSQTSSVSQTTDAAGPAVPAAAGGDGGSSPATSTPAEPAAPAASGTYTGAAAATRFGNVQVQITVAAGTITDVTALQLTNHDQRSVSISNRAAPVLRQQVLAAQSANVQGVSGATYTTDGYLTSLQSALDQAGL